MARLPKQLDAGGAMGHGTRVGIELHSTRYKHPQNTPWQGFGVLAPPMAFQRAGSAMSITSGFRICSVTLIIMLLAQSAAAAKVHRSGQWERAPGSYARAKAPDWAAVDSHRGGADNGE